MIVVVEIVAVIREIGLHDVGPAIVVIIFRVHAHAGLFASIAAVGDAGFRAQFGEPSLAVVVVEHAG